MTREHPQDNPPVNRVFILPESFDPCELLWPKLHKFADDARYFVSTILRKTARGQTDDYGYVALKAEHLTQIISERKCKEIVESLLAAGAVRRRPYQKGVRSFSYRLADQYQADQHIRLPIENKRLLRKLEQHCLAFPSRVEKALA